MQYTATYSSPLGMIVLESDGEVLTGLRFMESSETQKQAIETLPADTTNTLPIFAEVRQWLDDYFAGKRPCNVPRRDTPAQSANWVWVIALYFVIYACFFVSATSRRNSKKNNYRQLDGVIRRRTSNGGGRGLGHKKRGEAPLKCSAS